MSNAPIVFLSHATEDKERFVRSFAAALRNKGIDAWVDEWEIVPGDSLVQKIFEEGIRSATAIIVVVSKISVTKEWVKEELDAAIIARITNATRLIPVVIEECDVPIALRATRWVRADGPKFEEAVDEIVRTIFSQSIKPPIGVPPVYVQNNIIDVPGLDRFDVQVLLEIGKMYIESGSDAILSKRELIERCSNLQTNDAQIEEAIEMLVAHHYLKATHIIGDRFHFLQLVNRGAHFALSQLLPGFERGYEEVSSYIVNYENDHRSSKLSGELQLPLILVNYVLQDLNDKGLIKTTRYANGEWAVVSITAQLRRSLR